MKITKLDVILFVIYISLLMLFNNKKQEAAHYGLKFYLMLIIAAILIWKYVYTLIQDALSKIKSKRPGEIIISILLIPLALLLFISPIFTLYYIKKTEVKIEKNQHQADSLRKLGR